jgi:hypothetical protein
MTKEYIAIYCNQFYGRDNVYQDYQGHLKNLLDMTECVVICDILHFHFKYWISKAGDVAKQIIKRKKAWIIFLWPSNTFAMTNWNLIVKTVKLRAREKVSSFLFCLKLFHLVCLSRYYFKIGSICENVV